MVGWHGRLVKAWDTRARKWYGDRFDFRRDMVGWQDSVCLPLPGTRHCVL